MVWNLFPFKGDFNFGKIQKSQGAKLGCSRAESLGDLIFHQKSLHKRWCMRGYVVMMKLPIAMTFSMIPRVSAEECSSLMQNVMQIHCSPYSVILNRWPHSTHLTQQCLPPPLTSTVTLSLFTHVHSSPLSLAASFTDVAQTVLVLLTMSGFSLDSLHICGSFLNFFNWIYWGYIGQ